MREDCRRTSLSPELYLERWRRTRRGGQHRSRSVADKGASATERGGAPLQRVAVLRLEDDEQERQEARVITVLEEVREPLDRLRCGSGLAHVRNAESGGEE